MSGPAPTAAAPAVVAPSDGGGEPAVERVGGDPFAGAHADLRERRKLRLAAAPKDEAVEVTPTANADTPDAEREDAADDAREAVEAEREDAAEPEDEAKPHWAKKLKAERDDLAAKAKDYAEREQKWEGALRQIKHAHEDASGEAKFWQGVAEDLQRLVATLPRVGADGRVVVDAHGNIARHRVDPESLRALMAERQVEQLRRQLERGQGHDLDARASAMSRDLQAKFADLVRRHPELDPRKHPAARDFVEDELERWKRNDGKWEGVDARAERFARAVRAELAAKAQQAKAAAQPPRPKPGERPVDPVRRPASTVDAAGRKINAFISDKMIKAELAANRLRRG